MKRKLLCIFFMLAGAAALVGTILLSLERPEEADASPVWTLIIFSAITIVAALWNFREPYKPEISERDRTILRAFRIVNILVILVCLVFVVMMLVMTYYYIYSLQYISFLMILASTGIILAALCLRERPPIVGRDVVKASVAFMISAVLVFVYMSCMPKYSLDNSIIMLRSEKENAENYIFDFGNFNVFGLHSYVPRWGGEFEASFGPNPFYIMMYQFGCDSYSHDSDGLHIRKGYINFNPANGAYEFLRTQEQDLMFSSTKWPEFNWNFLKDRDGQHSAVLNLYFRELDASGTFPDTRNPMLTVGADEWDVKLMDTLYPHNFPEDEARSFLQSIGEEELKTKLLKQINDLAQVVVFDKQEDGTFGLVITGTKDETVEVYFFGINIATYQNGEIVLKI